NGRVNGRVNGRTNGRTNGFIKGTLPNGRGLQRKGVMRRSSTIIISLVVLFASITVLIPESPPGPATSIKIDGKFSDWSGVPAYSQGSSTSDQDVDIREFALLSENGYVSIYVGARGTILEDPDGLDSVYIFIDMDGDSQTGYRAQDIGAERLVQIAGSEGSVSYTRVATFQGTDPHNWSAWRSIGSCGAAVAENGMEVQLFPDQIEAISENFQVRISMDNYDGASSWSQVPFGPRFGALRVVQTGLLGRGVLDMSTPYILELRLRAFGSDIEVEGLNFRKVGNFSLHPIDPFVVPADTTVRKYVSVNPQTIVPGEFVEVSLASVDADATVTILGKGQRTYAVTKPSEKRVDGFFGDWQDEILVDVDTQLTENPNVDMNGYSTNLSNQNVFAYLSVKGEILGGLFTPEKRVKVSPGEPGEPSPPSRIPRVAGEDVALVYIDTNSSVSQGYPVGGLRANYLVKLTGIGGKIIAKELFEWDTGRWKNVGSVEAEVGDRELEVSVSAARLGELNSSRVFFQTTDWARNHDKAWSNTTWSTRTESRSIYVIESTTSSASSTAYSHQRKIVYDGTYFWAFYYDGDEGKTMYEYSSSGESWSNSAVSAFSTSGVNYASVWLDSDNSTIYIVGDTSASDATVITRKGTISGASISWGSEYTVTVSGSNLDSKVAFISRSSTGYIWIVSSCQETNYNIAGVGSTNTDDVSAWDTRTVLRTVGDVSNDYVFPQIAPLLGGDIYVVWYADGNIEGRGYDAGTSSWDTNEASIATTAGTKDKMGPSVVADSSQTLHLIYSDSSGYIQYMYRETSGSWTDGSSDPETNSQYNFYPTLSLLTTNDNLYAFYMRGNQIYCKVWGGSSWSEVTLTSDTNTKTHLTSTYSGSGDGELPWIWRQETLDYEIAIERIPEFEHLILPIVLTGLVPFVRRLTRSRRTQRKCSEATDS
ncbi:MAG: hypothetical protein KAS60_08290, partial [Thermoplasmata archaeon]|nr:hypothetical protein [Thermoplasmata archaeon]